MLLQLDLVKQLNSQQERAFNLTFVGHEAILWTGFGLYPLPKPAREVFLRRNSMKKACRKLLLRQALHVGATGFEPATS